jgi:hypothetical protein
MRPYTGGERIRLLGCGAGPVRWLGLLFLSPSPFCRASLSLISCPRQSLRQLPLKLNKYRLLWLPDRMTDWRLEA